ncbi:hypothetical protein H8959_007764, partial [Pygathrix nigripes]
EGYRDGIDAGKAVALQQGFNQGYKEGAEVILNYGRLRGTLRKSTDWSLLGLRAPLRSREVEMQLRLHPLRVAGHMASGVTPKQPTELELEATLLSQVPQSGRATPRFPARLRAPGPPLQTQTPPRPCSSLPRLAARGTFQLRSTFFNTQ